MNSTFPLINPADPRLSEKKKLSPHLREMLNEKKFNELEEEILGHLEENPDDPPFFLPVIRALQNNGHKDQAQTYIQLLVESLSALQDKKPLTDACAGILKIEPDNQEIKSILIDNLSSEYADKPNRDRIMSHCNVHGSTDPLKVLSECEAWLAYDETTPVYMENRGAGKVHDINLSLGKVRARFLQGNEEVSLRLDEAKRLFTRVEPGDFFYELLQNPDALKQLAQEDAGALLQKLFSGAGSSLRGSDVKKYLKEIIPESRWNTWWKKARTDPRIMPDPAKKNVYIWKDSTREADTMLWEEFCASSVEDKLTLFRTHSGRKSDMVFHMAQELVTIADNEWRANPSRALEIALTLEKHASSDTRVVSFTYEELFRETARNAVALFSEIQDRTTRKRALDLLHAKSDTWAQVYDSLLTVERDSPLIEVLYSRLYAYDPEKAATRVDSTLMNPTHAPRFYVWICTKMLDRPELKEKANWAFVQGLLKVLGHDTFREDAATLRDAFDPGGAAFYAIGNLDVNDAAQLKALLRRDTQLEEYRVTRIVKDLDLQFKELRDDKKELFYVTQDSIDRVREQLQKLVKEELPENAKEIKRTREYGDLRENFEYHAARARHERLSSQAQSLTQQLEKARAIQPEKVDTTRISIGTRVQLRPVAGSATEPLCITILGPWDSESSEHVYSYQADAIAVLLGKKPGDTIEFNDNTYTVWEILPWGHSNTRE